jgi:hypothetical protein
VTLHSGKQEIGVPDTLHKRPLGGDTSPSVRQLLKQSLIRFQPTHRHHPRIMRESLKFGDVRAALRQPEDSIVPDPGNQIGIRELISAPDFKSIAQTRFGQTADAGSDQNDPPLFAQWDRFIQRAIGTPSLIRLDFSIVQSAALEELPASCSTRRWTVETICSSTCSDQTVGSP